MEPRETHESSAKAPAKAKAAVSDRHDSGDESDVEDSSAGSQPGASEDEVTLRVRRARTPPRRPPPTGRNLYGSLHVGGVKIIPMDGESLGVWFLFTVSLSSEHKQRDAPVP
jgi:hypothetical protein